MATVAISDLQCGVTYALIAEGMSNGMFVGPASSHGNITTGPCPVMTSEYVRSCMSYSYKIMLSIELEVNITMYIDYVATKYVVKLHVS